MALVLNSAKINKVLSSIMVLMDLSKVEGNLQMWFVGKMNMGFCSSFSCLFIFEPEPQVRNVM
jgi:hypothetical protein